MIHQPYEDWLLANPNRSEEVLSAEQSVALRDHMAACEVCRQFAIALNAVDSQMQMASMMAPEPGFTNRWKVRFAEQRIRIQRRQSLTWLGICLASAAIVLGLILMVSWPLVKSPELLVLVTIHQATRFLLLIDASRQFLVGLLFAASINIPWIGWVLAAGVVSLLGVLWVVSYRLITNPRRIII